MSVPRLQDLARRVPGGPDVALSALLALVCEQLGADLAVVMGVAGSAEHQLLSAVSSDGEPLLPDELPDGLLSHWSPRVVAQEAVLDTDVPAVGPLRSLAGVVLRDGKGTAVAVLCAVDGTARPDWNARDSAVLAGLGQVIGEVLEHRRGVVRRAGPAPMLSAVAESASSARDLEELSRPLLDALHDLTGLASSYLTVIHDDDVQEIRFARNTRDGFALPEGLLVPWGDTLCKRALDEGRACTTDVASVWSDSQAAAELGISVYVSVPVALSDGRVWGTLCAADSAQTGGVEAHLPTMRLFATLIAAQVEREAALQGERQRAEQARVEADTDALTRCSTRRVVEPWLRSALKSRVSGEVLLVVYADVDGFKRVNDDLGHAAGDAVLVEVGRRLHLAAQPGDLVARMGGDEFLAAAVVPRASATGVVERYVEALTFPVTWGAEVLDVQVSVGWTLSEGDDAMALVEAADASMYAVKRARRAAV